MNEQHDQLANLLRRDAARIRKSEKFDAKLHQDTMRRIRQLDDTGAPRHLLKFAAAVTTAAAVCVIVLLSLRPSPDPRPGSAPGTELAKIPAASGALAYRQAFADGEDALIAMLDQDARALLPPSAQIFKSGL